MEADHQGEVTMLLRAWREGDPAARDALFARVYEELRRIADQRMRSERLGHTLQPTALIGEAWLRLARGEAPDWQSRAHFFGVAARVMRQILIDHARAHSAARRQGGLRVELTSEPAGEGPSPEQALEVLELHEALDRLFALDERRAKVLELRYFGGLERPEIAEVLGVTERMVKRDLMVAQAWLRRELDKGGQGAQA